MMNRSTLSLLVLLTAGACAETPETSYRENYPVQVRAQTIALPLATPQSLSPEDEARLAVLVKSYLDRGHGPVTVATGMADREAEVRAMRQRLIAAGISASAIRMVMVEDGSADGITISYDRYTTVQPNCGDWSSSPSFNPYNQAHSNFGCAQQRNLGVMVADPADLVRMRDPAPTDAQNSNRVVQRYRAGEPTNATYSPLQNSNGNVTSK